MQESSYLKETPSQTAGPYVHIGLTPNFCDIGGVYAEDLGSAMVNDKTLGERITVTGRIYDGTGALVRDAVVEIWQADSAGLYNSPSEMRGTADPNFTGWGRCPTSAEDGAYIFETVKPGRVPFKDGSMMAPHISFWIVARGINIGLHTRMYFPEEADANKADPLLSRIEHRERTATMIASRDDTTCTFDIRLQGEQETVFLDI
ncbi:protocatechuate 3,4-dioxygenase subunit alpha (plasmid) [Rhizobium sullae]|uniref:Protocatechuate 3,4-dioxygenase subunit alpha n=1 Tax=Rhizobium sullae TaxID=50338 RepID=A0ABY5XV38_RHISU|nr:protocatechuate 3,4-dioxygenase subunit alpha [Rhizobium sullae]UWU18187.1 protocatechuate 3,4-dioxygenase subunit alpha [Rhizobium sullae]